MASTALVAPAAPRLADPFEATEAASKQVVDEGRERIGEGDVRRLSLRKGDEILFEIPLPVGAATAAP